jgi:drug/metabolite transporter (DMT)-like permease
MSTKNSTNRKAGLLLSLTAAVLWGLLPIIMKGAIRDFDPFTATWFRFAGGVAGFGLWLLWCRPSLLIPRPTENHRWMLPLAVLCMSGNSLFLTWSLSYQSPSITQTVLQIGPPMVFLGGALIFKEDVDKLQWLGLLAILPGLGLFFNTELANVLSGKSPLTIGVLLISISAVCFASYSLLKKAMMSRIPAETTLFWGLVGGVIILLPFAKPAQWFQASPIAIAMLVAAMFNTFLPFFCYGEAFRLWDASRVGAIIAMTPIVTVFATGAVARVIPDYIHSEQLNLYTMLGIVVVVGGSMTAALGKSEKEIATSV